MKSPCPKDMTQYQVNIFIFSYPELVTNSGTDFVRNLGSIEKQYVYMFFKINIWFKTNSQKYMIIIVKFIY